MAANISPARTRAVPRSTVRRPALVALALLPLLIGGASGADAAPPWLASAFRSRADDHGRPLAGLSRYRIDAGGSFVFGREARVIALRFDDNPEVWALTSVRGPRGDTLFLNDLGQPLVRTTRLGGVTVFTRRRPEGAAASIDGPVETVRPGRVDPAQVYQRLILASARASRAAGRLIAFQAMDVDAASSGVIADAATVAGEAVVQLSTAPSGRAILARVERFDFRRGRMADVGFGRGVVVVTVKPDSGPAGRPSSARILQALGLGPAMPVAGP